MFVALLIFCGFISGCGATPTSANQSKPAKKPATKSSPKKSTGVETNETRANPKPPPAERPSNVQKIRRPEDTRPVRDDSRLTKLGFTKLTSSRFILYSDLPKEDLADLPEAMAQLCFWLEKYFGPMPPDSLGKPYQMTGYLMADPERFRAANILAEGPAQPHEGWYLANEFWWNRQATPYYTRHLMMHEATHCFMHVMPSMDCPPWYVEGMAELFGTHGIDEKGNYFFGIFPDTPDRSPGWGRVTVLQEEIANGRMPDVDTILKYSFDDFAKLPPYAWSWALCHFLNTHPRYQVPFRDVAKHMMDGGFLRYSTEAFRPHLADLQDEWLLYASQIQYGHDIERSVIDFQPGVEISKSSEPAKVAISATKGWQSAKVNLIAGRRYRVQGSGQFTIAKTTKPWISEAQGISIRYFAGQPFGRLMGVIRPQTSDNSADREILKLVPLGPDSTFVAPHAGTLYLRLNDAWNELADNAGEVQVKIRLAEEGAK